ncbi:MAG: hypothetical protein ACM3N5_16630 [Candidatus Eiseniibacteriota bacterium]
MNLWLYGVNCPARQPAAHEPLAEPGRAVNVQGMFKSASSRAGVLLAVVLAALLAFAIGITVYMWRSIGAVDISTDGVIALVFGVGFSLALGIGLMRLVYFSSRRGYDDNVD